MPYSPGIAYRGDQYIAQGGRDFGQALFGIATGLMDEQKKVKATDARNRALYKALTPAAGPDGTTPPHPMGVDKQTFDMMSFQDRAGTVTALEDKANIGMELATRKLREEQLAAAVQNRTDQETYRQGLAAGVPRPAATGGTGEYLKQFAPRRELNPDEMLRLGMQTGQLTPRDALHFAVDSQRDGNLDDMSATWIEDEKTGARFLGRGRTTLPSGTNPEKSSANLPTIPGYTGAPTGRGGYTWLKTPNGEAYQQKVSLMDRQAKHRERNTILASIKQTFVPDQISLLSEQLKLVDEALQSGGGAASPASP